MITIDMNNRFGQVLLKLFSSLGTSNVYLLFFVSVCIIFMLCAHIRDKGAHKKKIKNILDNIQLQPETTVATVLGIYKHMHLLTRHDLKKYQLLVEYKINGEKFRDFLTTDELNMCYPIGTRLNITYRSINGNICIDPYNFSVDDEVKGDVQFGSLKDISKYTYLRYLHMNIIGACLLAVTFFMFAQSNVLFAIFATILLYIPCYLIGTVFTSLLSIVLDKAIYTDEVMAEVVDSYTDRCSISLGNDIWNSDDIKQKNVVLRYTFSGVEYTIDFEANKSGITAAGSTHYLGINPKNPQKVKEILLKPEEHWI